MLLSLIIDRLSYTYASIRLYPCQSDKNIMYYDFDQQAQWIWIVYRHLKIINHIIMVDVE